MGKAAISTEIESIKMFKTHIMQTNESVAIPKYILRPTWNNIGVKAQYFNVSIASSNF